MEQIKVLYIDDEKDNLLAFKASFRRLFDVYLAENAKEGIRILKKHSIEVVIADQRMPEMTGVEFFESILNEYPNPMRILLTGYSDINAVKDAINKGQVYRYISKPWDEFELKTTIEDAYHFYQLREQNNKLQNKYQKIFSESSDTILILDEDGKIVDYNKSALFLLEPKPNKLNLLYFFNFINNDYEKDYIIETLKNNDSINNYECVITLFNGTRKNCLISANKIKNSYGRTLNYQAIIRDITTRRTSEELLLKTIIHTQEFERARISRDLHDGLGQNLVGIKYQLEYLKTFDNSESFTSKVNSTIDVLVGTILQLRTICYNITPPSLNQYGIKNAIEQLSKNVSSDELEITTKFLSQIPLLDKDVEIAIYRITQEFINNAYKHAKCNNIEIIADFNDENLLLTLKDNGIGFDVDSNLNGLGLSNVTSRVKSFHGEINIISQENIGTEFKIKFPIKNILI